MLDMDFEIERCEKLIELQKQIIANQETMFKKEQYTIFYTVDDISKMLNWSKSKVRQLFSDPEFKGCDYGKGLVIKKESFDEYFSKPRYAAESKYWSQISFKNQGV